MTLNIYYKVVIKLHSLTRTVLIMLTDECQTIRTENPGSHIRLWFHLVPLLKHSSRLLPERPRTINC